MLLPEDFQAQPALRADHVSDLTEALTRQILTLLSQEAAGPGDVVFLELKGIVTRICQSRTVVARWAQSAFLQTAARFGVLRYRPRCPRDPSPASRTHIWEISQTAPALVSTVTLELATMQAGRSHWGGHLRLTELRRRATRSRSREERADLIPSEGSL
ncbi:hypothetical protein [Streptomyces sp. NPDC008001]|uniref:hypothetical protein n=1 Tax=Streptomyces sp. NPDC008001 TaxID=3364804 RepID=UPI0036EA5FE9